MFERFTDRSRRIMVLAQQQARLFDDNFIGTEHLLLGLIAEGEGVAAIALTSLGLTFEGVSDEVRKRSRPSGSSSTGSPPFTPRAKKVLELSLREALQLGHRYIGTEHLLLGLVREGTGTAAVVITNLGVDLSVVRQQVIQLLSGYAPPTPERAVANAPRRRRAPTCPSCRASLEDQVAYRTLPANSIDESDSPDEPAGATIDVVWVFCRRCGTVIAPLSRTDE